ncbi:MAG: hypothetical protein PHO02_03365 [Candidatus Nanoarchaeia archaeon]|nr:hypothetical protein [Candidatus Nanoarchaeia archaeon]
MVVGPSGLGSKAYEISCKDKQDVAQVLEEELDRLLAAIGKCSTETRDGINVYDPAKLVSKRLPHIPRIEKLVEEVFEKTLKAEYERAGWHAQYNAASTNSYTAQIMIYTDLKLARLTPKQFNENKNLFSKVGQARIREAPMQLNWDMLRDIDRMAPKSATHYFVNTNSDGEIWADYDGDALVDYYRKK